MYFICRVAKVQRVQTEIEQADLEKHEALLYSFQATLGDTEESYHLTLSELLATIKDRKLQDDARLQIEVFGAWHISKVFHKCAAYIGIFVLLLIISEWCMNGSLSPFNRSLFSLNLHPLPTPPLFSEKTKLELSW